MGRIFGLSSEVSFKHIGRVITCVVALWVATPIHTSAATVESPNCPIAGCDLLADGTYTGVLIGQLDSVLSEENSSQLLRAAQARGRLGGLPPDSQQFSERIQAVAMRVPTDTGGSARVIALMAMDESRAMPLQAGDLVRFRPHGPPSAYSANPPPVEPVALAYWKAVGCVTALCRAGDKTCQAAYIKGAWRFTDGQAIEPLSTAPLTRGRNIDPLTYFPQPEPAP